MTYYRKITIGRTHPIPLTHYPRLLHATPAERNNWRLIAESQRSFQKWLDERAKFGCDPL